MKADRPHGVNRDPAATVRGVAGPQDVLLQAGSNEGQSAHVDVSIKCHWDRLGTGQTLLSIIDQSVKSLARRVRELTAAHEALTRALDSETTARNPGLRAVRGVGPDTAAQLLVTAGGNPERMRTEASFVALCGAAPVPASSGRTNRHRLSAAATGRPDRPLPHRPGPHVSDSRTRECVARQTTAGRTKKEIIRLLKRVIAREMFRCLTSAVTIPGIADLRPLRQSKNIRITAAARHFGLWPGTISTLERGIRRDEDLARTYRDWLRAAWPFDANTTSLVDGGGLKRSGQEGPVPAFREILPHVLVPARRIMHPCREGLKETVEALVLPFVSPTEVVLTQFSNEGNQFAAAADFVVGSQ